MEDTLRYFFSALFQGFAAIITLGIMFYLYYLDKQSRKVDEIEKELSIYIPSGLSAEAIERYNFFLEFGIIAYVKEYLIKRQLASSQYFHFQKRIEIFDSITEQKKVLSEKLKLLFKISRTILIGSLISLFLVGYFNWLNIILAVDGLILIVLTIIFFARLFSFSKTIIDGPF